MGTFNSHVHPIYAPDTILASGVICVRPINLIGIWLRNTGAATVYVFMFNSITVPGNGTKPSGGQPIKLEAGTSACLVPPGGQQFSVGMSWAVSSTDNTLTLAAAEMWVTATYRTLGGVTT